MRNLTLTATLLVLAPSQGPAALDDSGWQPVRCLPADLSPEQMFEVVQSVDDFEGAAVKWSPAVGGQHTKATVQRDTREHHGGGAALRVDYDFVGKRDYEYVQLNGAAAFAKPGLGFGFWLKHDGTPFALRLRYTDASGETHQTELLASAQPGWQFVAGALDAHSTAWGGDGNRRKDYPCKLAGICVDRPGAGFVGKGSLWIDDATIVRPASARMRLLTVEAQPKTYGNLYAVGDTVTLRANGDGERVRWTVTDVFGGEVRGIAGKAVGVGVKTKAWITEIGYPTHRASGGSDLAAQARHTVRTLALLQSMPEVAKVFWYDFKDDGLTREYNEHNFGLVHHQQFNCAPKPGIVAASVFIRQTVGATPTGLVKQGDVFTVPYRRPDGSDVVVAWSAKGTAKVAWAGEVKAMVNLMGATLPIPRAIELTENPVYLMGRNLKLDARR